MISGARAFERNESSMLDEGQPRAFVNGVALAFINFPLGVRTNTEASALQVFDYIQTREGLGDI